MRVRVASAGTGKTTSLVLRYLELIAGGLPLRRIAGVTFTRAAADELRQRVDGSIRELLATGEYLHVSLDEATRAQFEEALLELGGATLTTIHGFMIESLRLAAPLMGLDPSFSILGEWEAQALFEEELSSVFYLASDESLPLFEAKTQLGALAPELLLTLFRQRSLSQTFLAEGHPSNLALQKLFNAAYRRFEVRLGAARLSPSEVERRALKLIQNPKALKRLGERFKYLLVDEFQDVNPLQGAYFGALERSKLATEVVGDPKQSIYGFRNADVGVFRRALHEGEQLEPLIHTRRHAPLLSRFLNHLTSSLAAQNMGFGPEEAPAVETKGEQLGSRGRVELHWITGEDPVGELRESEAKVLAQSLQNLHEAHGYAYHQMAVLARSYSGLKIAENALAAAHIPYVLLQGRGYFERTEIRDLYHALRVGLDPKGLSLAAWLRGPYAGLEPQHIANILKSEAPLETLALEQPDIAKRLDAITQEVRGTPLGALKFLIREPFINNKRYVDFLETRARENVDALLFTVAQQPPGDIERLLERLNLLSRQTDAGDVPQSGDGVQLLTVHKSKGLEWPVVAIFDAGRAPYHPPQDLYVAPDGHIHHRDCEHFEAVRKRILAREDEESYRLLYVAASRPKNVLVVTGSVKNNKIGGWLRAFNAMNLGPNAKPQNRDEFVLKTHPHQRGRFKLLPSAPVATALEAAPYIDKRFRRYEQPPVTSPSRVKSLDAQHEPLPFSDPEEGERLPGRATTVGTLTHYAISQDWSATNAVHLDNLRSQEVMFPFTPDEQDDILIEVKLLLGNYEALLGRGLPTLNEREEDHPELPMALPVGKTVWQGVIDRLYCAAGVWYLEDYKTDQVIKPESYYFQLGVYSKAIEAVRGIRPQAQLVYLREKKIVKVSRGELEKASLDAG